MVLPIPVGTMLRQRYQIQNVLGQGGFGRTYLALDQERFNEPCVIKEFVVPYQDGALVEKSKTLFQREASILYQIQHPQIPRFWAAFEDEQRLFLVQDFVDGQTYRQLLSDRKQQGQAFAEAEVLHFLKHFLPVLTYIHDRDIVHRDITPENIILRQQGTTELASSEISGLPVLIDFGAVKEATSHWPLMSTATRVGKVGYAPPEQLQTGKVYPNSDLYALAATALALLTGKEPQSLLDSQTLSWRWEPYAHLSEELGRVLRQMLAVYPGDRYHSAQEVLAHLQPLLESSPANTLLPATPPGEPLDSPVPPTSALFANELEQPVVAYTPAPKRRAAFVDPTEGMDNGQPFDFFQSLSRVKLGLAATVLIGLGIAVPVLWQAFTSPDSNSEVWISGAKVPRSEASRIIESQRMNSSNSALKSPIPATDPATSHQTTQSPKSPQTIQFPPGKISTIVQGNLNHELQPYMLKGFQGQILTATLEGEGVTMNLLRSNQDGIDPSAYRTQSWTGVLPADDQYQIQIIGSGEYSLDLAMSPLSRPSQEETLRVTFARSTSGTTVTGQLSPTQVRRYVLKAKQGQILALKTLEGSVNLAAIAPNGQRIGGSATNSKTWQGRLPDDGDYVIEVTAPKAGNYVLSLEVF